MTPSVHLSESVQVLIAKGRVQRPSQQVSGKEMRIPLDSATWREWDDRYGRRVVQATSQGQESSSAGEVKRCSQLAGC